MYCIFITYLVRFGFRSFDFKLIIRVKFSFRFHAKKRFVYRS